MTYNKGANREWEFCRLIDDTDEWAVMRAPASGTADREMPDLFVGNADRVLAIELKASAKKPAYVTERELRDLRYLARKFRAEPYAAVIHDVTHDHPARGVKTDPGFRFVSVATDDSEGLRFTGSGNLSLTRSETLETGETFTDLFGYSAFDEELVADGGYGRERLAEYLTDDITPTTVAQTIATVRDRLNQNFGDTVKVDSSDGIHPDVLDALADGHGHLVDDFDVEAYHRRSGDGARGVHVDLRWIVSKSVDDEDTNGN